MNTAFETARISVVLADDHALLRQSLQLLLTISPDIDVVGEAQTGQQAIEQVVALHPQVVVLDLSMPAMNGFEACQEICARVPQTHVLILTMHEDEGHFFQALQAGAAGYLLKKAAPRELHLAIRAISRGQAFVSPELLKALVQASTEESRTSDSSPGDSFDGAERLRRLSPRQVQILKLIVRGQTNQHIADLLGISIKTVQAHRANVMERLGLVNVAHLVRFAIRYQDDSGGSIPFIDVGNRYQLVGASYSYATLQDSASNAFSWQDIASSLGDTNSPIAQNILGTANYLTAAICTVDGQQPGSVCQVPAIQQIEQALGPGASRGLSRPQ